MKRHGPDTPSPIDAQLYDSVFENCPLPEVDFAKELVFIPKMQRIFQRGTVMTQKEAKPSPKDKNMSDNMDFVGSYICKDCGMRIKTGRRCNCQRVRLMKNPKYDKLYKYTPTRMIDNCLNCNCLECTYQRALQLAMFNYDTPVFRELQKTHTEETGTHIFIYINYMEIAQFYGIESLQDIATIQQWHKDMNDIESTLYKERLKRAFPYSLGRCW